MKFNFLHRIFVVIILVLTSFSCSSDLDFEQAKEFNIQPVFTTNFAYLNGTASDFIENGVETPIFSYVANTDFLNNSFVEEDLLKAEMYFRIKNTLNKPYRFAIAFLNETGAPIHTIVMDVPASTGVENIVERTETFSAANIDIIKSTTKMIFTVVMGQGPPLTASTPGRVELSSSLTAYFYIE